MNSSTPVIGKSGVFSQVISYFTNRNSDLETENLAFDSKNQETNPEMANSEFKTSESAYLNKKAQMLQNAHRMSEEQSEWFKSTPDTPSFEVPIPGYQDTAPSYLKQKKFLSTEEEVSTSQLAYNINSNCFENLQVQQTIYNPYSSYIEEDFHSDELQYFPVESELPQQFFLPFGNLYTNIMEFVETTIVQYVCQRSHPSPFRIAAEILARSRLNPNANEFTPTKKNATVIETDPEEIELHCSTPNCDSTDLSNSFDFVNSLELGNPSDSETSTSMHEEKEIRGKVSEEHDSKSGEKADPQIKLVQCVKDNSFCDIENNEVCDSLGDSLSDDSDDDCMSDDYDDDDSDWDSEEQSTGQCVEIDPSEFEDLFPSPLLLSNLSICQSKSSSPKTKIVTETPFNSSKIEVNSCSNAIGEINKKYFDQKESSSVNCITSKTCCVKFCDDVVVIEEPDDIAEDLQNARISDFPARKADQERMERLLAPILTKVHRDKMFQKIYGDQ